MQESIFNNLCNHYKDTYDIHLASIKQRETLFYILLIVLSLFTLQISSMELTSSIITGYFNKTFGSKLNSDFSFASTFLWLFLLGVSTKYFQKATEIERQYHYIHALENELNKNYQDTAIFTREGASYNSRKSMLSTWIWFFYTVLFPLIILLCITSKTLDQIGNMQKISISQIIDFISYLFIGTTCILYLLKIHAYRIENTLKSKN